MNNHITPEVVESFAEFLRSETDKKSHGAMDKVLLELSKLSNRLEIIEQKLSNEQFTDLQPMTNHPSVEKFAVGLAFAENGANTVEKICTYEPLPKPCDNCSMCNTRGF